MNACAIFKKFEGTEAQNLVLAAEFFNAECAILDADGDIVIGKINRHGDFEGTHVSRDELAKFITWIDEGSGGVLLDASEADEVMATWRRAIQP